VASSRGHNIGMTQSATPEAGTVTLANGQRRRARRTYMGAAPYVEQPTMRNGRTAWRATSPQLAATFKAQEG
jgi:hypothetical protein